MKRLFFVTFLIFCFYFAALAQDEDVCPGITIVPSNYRVSPNEIATYTAEVEGKVRENIKYIWKVDGGKILSGQGTKSINVFRETSDVGAIVLEVLGLPKNCSNFASDHFMAIDPIDLVLFDSFGKITLEDEKSKIDKFFADLQKMSIAEGIITLNNDANLMKHLRFLDLYFLSRNFDKTLISYVISDEVQENTKLWLVPPYREIPDCNKCLIIKGEDFEKITKLFEQKPKEKRDSVKNKKN